MLNTNIHINIHVTFYLNSEEKYLMISKKKKNIQFLAIKFILNINNTIKTNKREMIVKTFIFLSLALANCNIFFAKNIVNYIQLLVLKNSPTSLFLED